MNQVIITLVTYNKYTKEVFSISQIFIKTKDGDIDYEDHFYVREPLITKAFVNTDPIILFDKKDPYQRLFIKDNAFLTTYKEE